MRSDGDVRELDYLNVPLSSRSRRPSRWKMTTGFTPPGPSLDRLDRDPLYSVSSSGFTQVLNSLA